MEMTAVVLPMASDADLAVWERLDDVIMGGQSSSSLTAAGDGSGADFSGDLIIEGGGFCGARTKVCIPRKQCMSAKQCSITLRTLHYIREPFASCGRNLLTFLANLQSLDPTQCDSVIASAFLPHRSA